MKTLRWTAGAGLALCALAAAAAPGQPQSPAPRGKASDMINWCRSMGDGAQSMALHRDRGMSRTEAVNEALKSSPATPTFQDAVRTMADVTWRYPAYSPAQVHMMAYGTCVASQLHLLDPAMVKDMENVVQDCAAVKDQPEAGFEPCTDHGFARLIAARHQQPQP